jgi:hypothetical protein
MKSAGMLLRLTVVCSLFALGCVESGLPASARHPANPHAPASALPPVASALGAAPPLQAPDHSHMHHHHQQASDADTQ